jgi:hypothetical protein
LEAIPVFQQLWIGSSGLRRTSAATTRALLGGQAVEKLHQIPDMKKSDSLGCSRLFELYNSDVCSRNTTLR